MDWVAASSMTRVPTEPEPEPDGPAEGMRRVTIDVSKHNEASSFRMSGDLLMNKRRKHSGNALLAIADAIEALEAQG